MQVVALAQVLYLQAKGGHAEGAVLAACTAALPGAVPYMDAYNVSNVAWSLARLQLGPQLPEGIVEALAVRFMLLYQGASAQDCANFLYACHLLGVR